MIKAIIFDLDGVLLDACNWHYQALNQSLALFGYNIPLDKHLTTFNGLPTVEKLRKLSEEINLPRGLHKIISQKKQQFTDQLIRENCKFDFKIHNMMKRLHSENLKLAICSNSIRKTVDNASKIMGVDVYLSTIMSNEDVKNSKPDPEIYIKTCQILKIKPLEALVVEDHTYGVISAYSAGCNVIQVRNPNDVTLSLIENAITFFNRQVNNSTKITDISKMAS
jgi:beta-phosphoglucomutase